MGEHISIDQMARDIRQIFASDDLQAEANIDRYLQTRLGFLPVPERVDLLEKLVDQFSSPTPLPTGGATAEEALLTRLFSLVLGGKFTKADLPSADVTRRLTESLNTIFDELNRLIAVIRSTLMRGSSGDQSIRGLPSGTIRGLISDYMEGDDQTESLQTYLGQISKAFLLAQQASKSAAYQTVGKILQELDPKTIRQEAEGGLKFGPWREAERYRVFVQEMKKCRQWYESGRIMEDFQREFEKYCQSKPI